MRLDPRLVLAVSAAAALCACARDLDMPPQSGAPRVATFSPTSAYAGQQLVITGSGFDTDPLGNLVQFARASARADSASEGSLVVRVPADAGDGKFTVTTKGGVSAPSATPFGYLGRGELGAKAISAERPMLHAPYRVIPANGETFLHSDLLVGLIRYGDPAFVEDSAVSVDQARFTNPPSVLWLESMVPDYAVTLMWGTEIRPAYVSTVVRTTVDAGGNLTRTAASIDDAQANGFIVAMQTAAGAGPRIAVFRQYPYEDYVYGPSTFYSLEILNWNLTQALPQVLVPWVYELRGCVDAGVGDLACLGRDRPFLFGGKLKLIRIRPNAVANALPDVAFAATTSVDLAENRQVNTNVSLQDPLCADTISHMAYVGLSDGRLGFAPTNVITTNVALSTQTTWSRAPARTLTCVPSGAGGAANATVLVSKHDDDLLLRIDPSTGGVFWTAEIPRATVSGLWCSGACTTGVVHAAGEADNAVRLLDLGSGALLARRTFDLQPGRFHQPYGYFVNRTAHQGAAWFQRPGDVPTLAFLIGSPPGVVEWPLSSQRTAGIFPHFRNVSASLVVPWSDGSGYARVAPLHFDTASWTRALDGPVQLAADGTDWIHLATSAGAETVHWADGTHAAWHTSTAFADWSTLFYDARGGAIVGALTSDSQALPQVWNVKSWSEAAPAGLPTASWTAPGFKVAATARLDGTLWAFYWDSSTGAELLHAVALTDLLTAVPGTDVVLDDPFYTIVAVSPNGGTFVTWERQPFSMDTSAVIRSPDGNGGFVRQATIPVRGQITGAAFDLTGEHLYVVTRGPDQIVVVE
jgi:hypothetical protein